MKYYLFILVLASGLYSCGPSENKTEDSPSTATQNLLESDSLLVLDNANYKLSVVLPKNLITEELNFNYRSSFGDVELFVNPKFHVYISHEDVSLAETKSELENDGLFEFKFYQEAQNELLYQSVLPDGTELGFNWVKEIETDKGNYKVNTDPQGDFSKQNIREIQKCLKTLKIA